MHEKKKFIQVCHKKDISIRMFEKKNCKLLSVIILVKLRVIII